MQELLDRWIRLGERMSPVSDALSLQWTVLESLYAFGDRPYHNLGHVADCLRILDSTGPAARNPPEVEFALFLHDCIYEASRKDNEERSAGVAAMFLAQRRAPAGTAAAVRGLILSTTHTGRGATPDECLLMDIDIAILGAPADEYDRYAAAIRKEFSFVSESRYAAGRGAFLRGMLARPRVYQTDPLHDRYEQPARANMSRELEGL